VFGFLMLAVKNSRNRRAALSPASPMMAGTVNPLAAPKAWGAIVRIRSLLMAAPSASGDDVGHAVACDMRIAADQPEVFVAGLGDQEAVEGIAVVNGQLLGSILGTDKIAR
jgi:hypothetical protein